MIHNNTGQEWWLQEVPMGAIGLVVDQGSDTALCYYTTEIHFADLPTSTWQIHSDSTTITEEQAGEIVEKCPYFERFYKNYEHERIHEFKALKSYHSILRSLGLEGKRIINLKKIYKMNDKLKEIAVYDGWEDTGRKHISLDYGNIYERKGKYKKRSEMFFSEFTYLTSLDWLHPVAMKVLGELCNVRDADRSYYISSIRCHCSTAPINGEYTELFDATYDAIVYLKNQSKEGADSNNESR